MLLGRLFNSLQHRLLLEEQEWRTINQIRREEALSSVQRFLLILGQRPSFWGAWLILSVLSFSLLSATVDPECWAFITITKFEVTDPSAYFIGLWSIQAAIAALVYPIVIAFVTVLLQISNNAKADLHIYLHHSSAIPAGLNALLLIMAMGLQYFGLPYVAEEVIFFWIAMDVLWFAFNTALTIRFLLQTFDFILPSKRDEIVRGYAINVAWPAEARAHLAQHFFLAACAEGLLPGPAYGSREHDEPCVLTGSFGYGRGECAATITLKGARHLKDVRFRLLRWAINRWKKRASLFPGEEIFQLPLTPLTLYEYGDVVLCSIQGKTKLDLLEKALVRWSFVFASPVSQGAVALSMTDIFSGMLSSAKAAMRDGQFERYKTEVERMTKLYERILKASEVKDSSGKTINVCEIGDRMQVFGRPVFEQWSRCFLDLFADAAKRLGDEPEFIDLLSFVPNRLFAASSGRSTPELSKHFLLLSHLFLRRIEDWWSETAERLGHTDHSLSSPIDLPAPHFRNHDKALIDFVGVWQDFVSNRFLGNLGEGASWSDFTIPAEYFYTHIGHTVVSLFDCLLRGDRNGAEWMTDILVKWYHPIEHRLPKASGSYLRRHQKLLTIDYCHKDWEFTQQFLSQEGEGLVDKVTPSAVFSSCLRNLWFDAIYISVYFLAEKSRDCSSDNCLPAYLLSALISGRSLRSGDETIRQYEKLASFNTLIFATIRQYLSGGDIDNNYEKRWNRLIEDIVNLGRPDMVSGRIYSGSYGFRDLRYISSGRLLILMLTVPTPWTPDASLRRLVNGWAATDNDKVRWLSSNVKDWKKQLAETSFLEMETVYDRLQRATEIGQHFQAAREALTAAIDALEQLLDEAHNEAVEALPIDLQRLQEIGRWASSLAFSSETGDFPLDLFEHVTTGMTPLERFSVIIQSINKGELTSPRCAPSVGGEETYYAETLRDFVAARILEQILGKLTVKEIPASTPEAYWLQVKAYAEETRSQGLTPILLVENPTVPSWIWEWQHPPYDGSPGENPPDLTVTRDKILGTDAYQCSFNGIEMYSVRIQKSGSVMLVKETMKKLNFRDFAEGKFVEVNTRAVAGNATLVDLVLSWEMEVEVAPYPAVRLTY